MTQLLKNVGEKLITGYVYFVCVWVCIAFMFEIFMLYTHFTDVEKEQRISNQIKWKIDGLYKNNPNNIWYEGPAKK